MEEKKKQKVDKVEKKLKKVIRKFSKPPMSARGQMRMEPISGILSEYNPRNMQVNLYLK